MISRRPIDPAKADLRDYYANHAGIRKTGAADGKEERAEERQESERHAKVRTYVMARERGICRCCRSQPAESRHELRFRSLGGKVTRENAVGVCGSGTTKCHGLLQRNEISYAFENPALGAEGTIFFTARTHAAAEAMKVQVGETIASPVMAVCEMDE